MLFKANSWAFYAMNSSIMVGGYYIIMLVSKYITILIGY